VDSRVWLCAKLSRQCKHQGILTGERESNLMSINVDLPVEHNIDEIHTKIIRDKVKFEFT